MAYRTAICEKCEQWENEGTVVLAFPTESEFKKSEYYDGGDNVKGDPYASKAVWVGKNNVGRSYENWWICTPVHPLCTHSWQSYEPGQESLDDDIKDFGIDLLAEQAEENKKYRQNRDDKRRKSHFYSVGIYSECDCSCPEPISLEDWTEQYIRRID